MPSTLQHLLSYYSSSLLLVYGWITQASFPGHVGGPENEATVLKIGGRFSVLGAVYTETRKTPRHANKL